MTGIGSIFLIFFFWAGPGFSQTLRCGHYIHSNKLGVNTSILKWNEDTSFNLEKEIEKVENQLVLNAEAADIIQKLIERNRPEAANLEMEKYLKRKLDPSEDAQFLARALALKAETRTVLIAFKKDQFTSFQLDLLSSIEKDPESELLDTVHQALEFRILNDKSKVLSTYYHYLASDGLMIHNDRSRVVGEYKQDFNGLDISLEPYGAILAVSYSCRHPSETLPPEATIRQHEKLIHALENKVQAIKKELVNRTDQITIKPFEESLPPAVGPAPSGRGSTIVK